MLPWSRFQRKVTSPSVTNNNWRGISLLDVVGKVFASIVQTRLQESAADFLPESHCGFRRGRSCSDMIFSVRQMSEKTIEHQAKSFFIFIDLKKAYDSVSRASGKFFCVPVCLQNWLVWFGLSIHQWLLAYVSMVSPLTLSVSLTAYAKGALWPCSVQHLHVGSDILLAAAHWRAQ